MSSFKFSLLTLNGKVLEDEIEKIVVTTSNGEITVLKNHIPLISTTNKGRLMVFKNGEKIEYIADVGVLKIEKDEVILMSESVKKI